MAMALKRLQREAVALAQSPPAGVMARPSPDDLLRWHYVLTGSADTPYAGGQYHGELRFPPEYPLKPPAVLMHTPSGRFQVNSRLCLSMSDFHPESWNPVWSVGTILVGLLSFMNSDADTVGSIKASDEARRLFAAGSAEANLANADFRRVFPDLAAATEAARAAAGGAAGGAGAGGAGGAPGAARGAGGGAGWLLAAAVAFLALGVPALRAWWVGDDAV